ncbi:MAG: hypothetical protein WC346_03015 [Methanogenium sp.]|jgi:hypothetical protein
MIKIAIIHPSYQRAEQCVNCFFKWQATADNPAQIEYFIALDGVDPTIHKYFEVFSHTPSFLSVGRFVIDIGDSTDCVKAGYRVSKNISSTTELLYQNSDDVFPCEHWDTLLLETLKGVDNFTVPKALAVNDGFWNTPTSFVYAIANRALYNKLGYLICPEYSSMYSDNDFTEVCNKLNCIIHAPHIQFLHKHYSKGGTPFDETYARRNNIIELEKGLKILNERRKRNFDLGDIK